MLVRERFIKLISTRPDGGVQAKRVRRRDPEHGQDAARSRWPWTDGPTDLDRPDITSEAAAGGFREGFQHVVNQ